MKMNYNNEIDSMLRTANSEQRTEDHFLANIFQVHRFTTGHETLAVVAYNLNNRNVPRVIISCWEFFSFLALFHRVEH